MNAEPRAATEVPALFSWRRLRVVASVAFVASLPASLNWIASYWLLYVRLLLTGVCLLALFGLIERWPRRLPNWVARWVLQVASMALFSPIVVALVYTLSSLGSEPSWIHDVAKLRGYRMITGLAFLVAPWVAMAAVLSQVRGEAERQALAFELERSELQRHALNARLRVLQSQVEPHFLFNTLANVRELVDTGSPQAARLLDSLIRYLRGAIPKLDATDVLLADELDMVRAYLEVMQIRMGERLAWSIDVMEACLQSRLPPAALLTLVENAVKHGVDPCEQGGRIDILAHVRDDSLCIDVVDNGVGMRDPSQVGTGLENLRQRLALAVGSGASVRVRANAPRGVIASLSLPLRKPSR